MTPITLLHVSDFHVTSERAHFLEQLIGFQKPEPDPRPSPQIQEALARVVAGSLGRFNALVITGDQADTGKRADLNEALRFVSTSPGSIPWLGSGNHPTLGGPWPIVLLPGNHDRFDRIAKFPGGRAFDSVFGSSWKTGLGGVQTHLVPEPKDPAADHLALVAADFCLQKALDGRLRTWFGTGNVNQETLKALETETRRLRKDRPGALVLWLLHFSPEAPLFLKLQKEERLLDKAEELEIPAILCGHTHIRRQFLVGNILIFCAGSATKRHRKRGNHFQAVTVPVADGKLVGDIRLREWEWNGASFVRRAVSSSDPLLEGISRIPRFPTPKVEMRQFPATATSGGTEVYFWRCMLRVRPNPNQEPGGVEPWSREE